MKLKILVLIALLITPALSQAESFEAIHRSTIHAEAGTISTVLGFIESGEFAILLGKSEQNGWVKIDKDGIVGWVFKRTGKIIAHNPGNDMDFWFGNLHAHTSEGSRESNIVASTHEEAFNYAMDKAKGDLDFLALTPHNHLINEDAYPKLLETVNSASIHKPGKFAALAGQEFNSWSLGNHVTIFELYRWIRKDLTQSGDGSHDTVKNGNFKELFEDFIPRYRTDFTFGQFNHPESTDFSAFGKTEYGRDDYDGNLPEWVKSTDSVIQLIEILNSPAYVDASEFGHYDEDNIAVDAWLWALSKGWHLAPSANQANHKYNWGSASDARTVVVSKELTRKSLISAFQQRRCYASEDRSMRVTFKAGGQWMGSEIRVGDFPGFTIRVSDPQEPLAKYSIEVFQGRIDAEPLNSNSEPIFKQDQVETGAEIIVKNIEVKAYQFYFAKITQSNNIDDPNQNADGDNAWTAPIWIIENDH